LLAIEADHLQKYFVPWHLVVKVPGGLETLPHLARRWKQHRTQSKGKHDDYVIADFDQSNAHNSVDRAAFLSRAAEIIPGCVCWLTWIYPWDDAAFVLYRDRVIKSCSGGQQGCPLIRAWHALVQRCVVEALGLCGPWPGTPALTPAMHTPPQIDIAALFSDDGFIAGPQHEVLRAISHLATDLPKLGLHVRKIDIIPTNPEHHSISPNPFVALGCQFVAEGNAQVMKSPVGQHVRAVCGQTGREVGHSLWCHRCIAAQGGGPVSVALSSGPDDVYSPHYTV
jgi:hypothetical protein